MATFFLFMRKTFASSSWGMPLLILLFGLVTFGSTLKVGFLWDDHEMIEKNLWIQDVNVQTIKHAFSNDVFEGKGTAYYRPMQTLFNMWDYRIWGLNPVGFHLTNLLLHLVSALLLFQLIKLVLMDEKMAFVTSLLFVVHPIIVEQLLIIAGRAELLAMMFGLAFLVFALQRSWQMMALSGFFYGLTCLSKESGVIFPLFLPLLKHLNPKIKILPRKYFLFGIVLAGYFVLRFIAFPLDSNLVRFGNLFPAIFRDMPVIFVEYLRILFFPVDLHSHRRLVASEWGIFLSYAVLLLTAILLFKKRSKFRLFCLAWFFLGFAPKLSLLSNNALMLDHWAYSSLIAVCLGLSKVLNRLEKKGGNWKILALSLGGFIFVFWIGIAWLNISLRNTDEKNYRWALKFPSSSVVRNNLAQIYYFEGNFQEAEHLYKQSLAMAPGSPLTINGLALVYWKKGEREDALKLLNDLTNKNPGFLPSFVNRATVLRGQEGLLDLKHVLDLDPNYEAAWALAGSIFAEQNKMDEAVLAYGEVIRINPRNIQALVDLGTLNALRGQFREAERFWNKALIVEPANEIALRNLMWLSKKLHNER